MIFAWILFSIYMLGTLYLGWLGYRRTHNFDGFAIGSGDLHPAIVGITMAASVASAATFIINPGFIYVHGLAAFMHMAVAVGSGFTGMLILLSFRFRRLGAENHALTMPHWIGLRFGSRGFAIFFAMVNLLALAFVVLIVGGLSIVMQQMLHLSNTAALIIILVFVTGYVFIGGTYAHVFTNTLQGSLMIIVTLLIFASGLHFFKGEGLFAQIGAIDPNLTGLINPKSNLFNNVFSVYISGFLIGAALVCQPHILTKALYVRSDRALKQYLIYGVTILGVFLLLPFAGFFTRLAIPPEQLVDASTGAFRQDLAMIAYVHQAFPPFVFTFISVVLLAAGMSTLDGILVSMSTITSNDLIVNLVQKIKGKGNSAENFALAYKLSHIVLVIIAMLAFLICLNPPKLLGIFGQVGVYGMAVAAVPPLLIGVLFKRAPLGIVWAAAAGGLFIHFFLYFLGPKLLPNSGITFANPGVTAALALIVSALPALIAVWLLGTREAKN